MLLTAGAALVLIAGCQPKRLEEGETGCPAAQGWPWKWPPRDDQRPEQRRLAGPQGADAVKKVDDTPISARQRSKQSKYG
ncbi:MAG: hypothetical protein ACQESR_22210 [Planctomycetota bacterium]